MALSPKAQKLILLLMDGAASSNEQEIAVRKLTETLRKEYPDGYALLADWNKGKTSTSPLPPPNQSRPSPYNRFVMPFGAHKGKMLKDVPVDYLLYILEWSDLFPRTRSAIEKFLAQQQ
jgi:hypothetical protein